MQRETPGRHPKKAQLECLDEANLRFLRLQPAPAAAPSTVEQRKLGVEFVQQNVGLVYGGGNVGLMGVLGDAVLREGGVAVGVIPENLMEREIAHNGLTKLHVVHSMREHKALMADLSDAFIALPGGFGTLEEFCEVVTWTQLGLHAKPCGILNVVGYY